MSLNDKYIINGSTLSAIGDALRSVYGETYQVNETVVVYQKSMQVSSFDTSSTETFNYNYIFGNSGIGFNRYGIEDTGYVRLSPSSGSYTVNATPVKENVYAFPFTVTVNGRGASARIYCYPVDENLDYIVYDQTIHKHDAYGYSYHRDIIPALHVHVNQYRFMLFPNTYCILACHPDAVIRDQHDRIAAIRIRPVDMGRIFVLFQSGVIAVFFAVSIQKNGQHVVIILREVIQGKLRKMTGLPCSGMAVCILQ